jgi:Tfp pilus assembly protein PilF
MERIDKLKSFLSENPDDAFLKHALALEFVKIGKEAEAREIFEDILRKDPSYIGSYYHLAKLLERTGEPALAIDWYSKGIEAARKAGDHHALNELAMAYEDLSDEV